MAFTILSLATCFSPVARSHVSQQGDGGKTGYVAKRQIDSGNNSVALQKSLSQIVRKDSWLDSGIMISNWKPMFPELFFDFSVEKADSMIHRSENLFYEMYGPRDSIDGKCRLHKLKNEPDPELFNLCRLFHCGFPPTESEISGHANGGYGLEFCNNLIPYFDDYWKMHEKMTPEAYRYLELIVRIPMNAIAESRIVLGLQDSSFEGDTQMRFMSIYSKRFEAFSYLMRYIDGIGKIESVDSVLYEVPFGCGVYD